MDTGPKSMNVRRVSVIAWTVWTVAVLSVAASLPLIVANRDTELGSLVAPVGSWPTKILLAFVFLAIPTVGALAASRHPENTAGWLLLSTGLLFTLDPFMGAYATYTLVTDPGALPGGTLMAWASETWGWTPHIGLLTALLVVFPGGRVPGRYPRALALAIAIPAGLLTIGYVFRPGALDNFGFLLNPYAMDGAAGQVMRAFVGNGFLLSYLGLGVAGASFLVRFWRAQGIARQQLKWFAYCAGLAAAYFPLGVVLQRVAPNEQLLTVPLTVLGLVIPATIPIAAGLAVLRYRLYDVDLFINRTMSTARPRPQSRPRSGLGSSRSSDY
jgi:hypothetical protein